jgi:hypothetical protein
LCEFYLASEPVSSLIPLWFAGQEFSLVERFYENIGFLSFVKNGFQLVKHSLDLVSCCLVVAFDAQKLAIGENLGDSWVHNSGACLKQSSKIQKLSLYAKYNHHFTNK